MLRRLRTVLVTLAMVGLAGAVCAMYLLGRVDEEIRAEVERRFRAHYPELSVHVRSARWFEGQGIRIRGVSIVEPTGNIQHAELAYVEEIFAISDAQLKDVVLANIPVDKIVFRGLAIRSTRREDGSWSAKKLWPPPNFSETPPTVRVEGGSIEFLDPMRPQAAPLVVRDIHLDIVPHEEPSPAGPPLVVFTVQGSVSSDHFRRAHLNASLREADGAWRCAGVVENFELSPELWQSLPPTLTQDLPPETSIRGRANFRFEASSEPVDASPFRFVVAGDFSDVRVSDPRLPYPLTDFQGTGYVDNRQIKIQNAQVRCGSAQVQLAYEREGLQGPGRQTLHISGRELALDPKLIKAIPDGEALWNALQPTGFVNVEANLTFNGQTWRPEVGIELLDVSFAYDDFPYRLHRGAGRVDFRGNELSLSVLALASGQYVRLDGKLHDPTGQRTGWLEIVSQGPVPINDQLLAALDEESREIVADFHPRGAATFRGRLEKTDPQADEFELQCVVGLRNCSMKHKEFPYPIESVQGVLEHRNGRWEFRDLQGWKGGAHISCHGDWTPTENGSRLTLHFEAVQVPLDDDLRYALSHEAQQIWTALRPRGVVDQLKVTLGYSTPERRLSLDVQATRWPNQPQTVDRRPLTIIPVWFPYRLDNITGSIVYRDGEIELQNLRADHGSTRLAAGGHVSTSPNGAWRMRLDRVTVDRLHYDRELAEALPEELRRATGRLAITGPLALRGWIEFAGSTRPGVKTTSRWDMACEMVGGSLDAGVLLENVHGGVRLMGHHDGDRFASRGRIDIDSLFCKGIQIARVQGPLYLDNTRVLLGAWAPPENAPSQGRPSPLPQPSPPRLTAQTLGGILHADARCSLTGDGEFALQATLTDADLRTIVRQATGQNQKLSGKVFGMVRLTGTSHGPHTWRGDGLVRLREADVYELPVMVSLLKVLRLQPPDTTAFTTSNTDFRIQGEHLYFDRIDFTGDAISLWGSGEMDLDRQLKLKLFVQVGRNDHPIPILGDLVGQVFREAGRNLLLIHVQGPLESPELRPETFPGLNEMFEQMFPEATRAGARANGMIDPRDALRTGREPFR